jgi:hypothetical protein
MASLHLSATFDLVDMNLLLKRLRIIGLPMDLAKLLKVWLIDCKFYVKVKLNGNSRQLYDAESGTIQGSVLAPIFNAILKKTLLNLTDVCPLLTKQYLQVGLQIQYIFYNF